LPCSAPSLRKYEVRVTTVIELLANRCLSCVCRLRADDASDPSGFFDRFH
jgi:hypothetical protein